MKPNIFILLSQVVLHWVRRNKKRGFYHDADRIKVSPVMLSRVITYRNDGGGSTSRGWLLPFFIYDNTLFYYKFQAPKGHSNLFLMNSENSFKKLYKLSQLLIRMKCIDGYILIRRCPLYFINGIQYSAARFQPQPWKSRMHRRSY